MRTRLPKAGSREPPILRRTQNRGALTIFALVALGVLIALGIWQYERRAWKNDLIARFEKALSSEPVAYEPPLPLDAGQAREFMRVKVSGQFENDKTIKLLTATPQASRPYTQDGFGYLLFTPLRFSRGVVFVNRGFVPTSLINDPQLSPSEQSSITGILRKPQTPEWLSPGPDPAKRLFYTADIPAMAAADGISDDRTVTNEYIESDIIPAGANWPKGRDPRELLNVIPNRHLEYALTWFGLALALAGVYIAYLVRN